MRRPVRAMSGVAAAGLALAGLTAAMRPGILSQAGGGLWEVSGAPGSQAQKICLPDPGLLAQFEHRRASCTRVVFRDDSSLAEVHYTCSGGGFGTSKIGSLTPRSFRIETQGISGNAPFHYTLQARKIGSC